MTYAQAAREKEMHRAAMSYQSDDQVLDILLSSKGWKQIVASEVLKERGHTDLVCEWHREDLKSKLALIDAVFAKL